LDSVVVVVRAAFSAVAEVPAVEHMERNLKHFGGKVAVVAALLGAQLQLLQAIKLK
jgi:hypothetical protein